MEQKIKEIIGKQFNQEVANMKLTDVLAKDYAAKSHDLITMSALIQREFDIKVSYMESHSCKTVGDWVNLVEKKLP